MLVGRFLPLLAALAVAGSLSGKRVAPPGAGTFRTDTPTFVFLLVFVIIIVAALTFFPALLLGPHRGGPDHPALLDAGATSISSALAVRGPHRSCSAWPTRSQRPGSPR